MGTSGVFNTASGHIDVAYGQVRSIHLQPVPEGPQGPLFVPRPQNANELPLGLVRQFVVEPLPATLDQGLRCKGGGDLIIALKNGRQITYGPCRWPWQISELWGAMIEAGEAVACDHGEPPTGVCGALRAARSRPFQTSF
jgi:hypothetical protein